MSTSQIELEPAILARVHRKDPTGEHLTPVFAHLLASGGHERIRRGALVSQVAMHVRGRGVARGLIVDHHHTAALARKLKGRAETGG
ncbi:hypothetical protein GCM10009771_05210 [Nesterenkonia flava]